MAETVNTPQRAFIYLRQSLDRTGLGAAIERQREDCLKLVSERGWDLARVWVDNDVSASSRKPRPEYVAMLEAIERGEAEVLVAWHVDRLTRRLTELEDLIDLAQRTHLRISTVTGDVDLSTDSGRLVGRILASVARGEVERKGARQKRAQQQAAEQGRPAGGRRPFGYGADGVTVNEAEARHVREAYVDLLQGASLKGIARRWNEAGALTTMGNAWTHSTVRNTLKNPRYAGLRTYRGEVVGPATWPELVDTESFGAVRSLLALPGRRTVANTARKWLLPSIALCWKCGSDVATGHSRHGKRLYVCRAHKCISRKAEPVDELIEAVVIARLSRPDAADLLSVDDRGELRDLQRRADGIRERLDDLATGLEEGVLTLQAVRKSSERLRAELATVEAQASSAVHTDVLRPLVAAGDVHGAWERLDVQQRRAAVDSLMTITLHPPERGHQPFDPESVRIEWKG
jgi:DNA invertase Pin-like site-specific DNA recombinase